MIGRILKDSAFLGIMMATNKASAYNIWGDSEISLKKTVIFGIIDALRTL